MEREKRKKEMKIKKRTEERKGGFPDQGSKRSEKEKKQFSINERKRTEILQARLPLRIILDWRYPTPHEQRGKRPKHPASSPKNTIL